MKTLVLLSDGMANEGLTGNDIITGPVQSAKNAGVKIYTIGFGDPSTTSDESGVDVALLQQIADETGGKYALADGQQTAEDLSMLFIKFQVTATQTVLGEFQGTLGQGARHQRRHVHRPEAEWHRAGGAQLARQRTGVAAHRPERHKVQKGYPGFTLYAGRPPARPSSRICKTGEWKVAVYGKAVSQPQEPFYALASFQKTATKKTEATTTTTEQAATTTTTATPDTTSATVADTTTTLPVGASAGGGGGAGGWLWLLAVVVVGAVAWPVVAHYRARGPYLPGRRGYSAAGAGLLIAGTEPSAASLVFANGARFPLREGANSIGRGDDNDIHVLDESAAFACRDRRGGKPGPGARPGQLWRHPGGRPEGFGGRPPRWGQADVRRRGVRVQAAVRVGPANWDPRERTTS